MLRSLMTGLRALLRPSERNAQIEEELRSFFEASVEEKIRSGMSAVSARRAAQIEIGSSEMVRHKVWSAGWESRVDSLMRESRIAARVLRKSPGFTVTAVLMLAFGIGATTAIFSVVDGVLLQPLPFPNTDRLVTLGEDVTGMDWGKRLDPGFVSAPEVATYSQALHSFSSLGGYGYLGFDLSGVGQPTAIEGVRMTPSVFAALGVMPLMGRVFTKEEEAQHAQVAVLSYRMWKSRFNSNPRILGSEILLDREPYLVIGVMPRSFVFPLFWDPELWVPMSFSPEELVSEANSNWDCMMVGLLKPGVTAAQAEDEANGVAQQIMRNFPQDTQNLRIRPMVNSLQQITVLIVRPLLRLLFWAVAVVMLIACANFAGLLLIRSIRRQREMAVRLALGATARTLLRQIMVESLLLSVAAGVIGIGLAAFAIYGGRTLLVRHLPGHLSLTSQITLNWRVAGFALLLAVLTGVFCGLAPGVAALRTNVNAQMKDGLGSASAAHVRLRSALVVLEIAVALILLAASGLLLRSFRKMNEVNLGFEPDHVATAAYSLPQKQYATQAMIGNFNHELLRRLQQLPGVRCAGLTNTLPAGGGGGGSATFVAEGYVDPRAPDHAVAHQSRVIGDYFRAMRIPLLRGRYFTDADHASSQLVVIVNTELAEHYWPHQDPIGKRMRLGMLKMPTPWMTVVGEVADARLGSSYWDHKLAQFYTPLAQQEKEAGPLAQPADLNGNWGYIVVQSALPPEEMQNGIRRVVRELDPQLPLSRERTMGEVLVQSQGPRRFSTAVIATFAVAAVLLAGLGIYSIVAFSVASRVQEMAIRIALGSRRWDILRLVLISGTKLAALGALVGLAGAAAAANLLRSFLFQVSPFDPAVLILAALGVFGLALAASVMPARRAATVDPIQALRSE